MNIIKNSFKYNEPWIIHLKELYKKINYFWSNLYFDTVYLFADKIPIHK